MNSLAMVVHGNGEFLFGGFLPNHVLVQEFLHLKGFGNLAGRPNRRLDFIVFQNRVAYGDALITDVSPGIVAGR
jgi:hypothetical protein